jgi:hypothetical protein
MAKAANVRSLEALREFRVALIKFIDKAKRAISTSDSEVTRTQIWLQSDQPSHWVREIRRSEERLNQAKSELFRATLSQPDNPRGPTDQVRLVAKRKEEIEHAKQQLEKTKRWSRTFERSTNDYRGSMSPLSSALDGTAHKAVVLIENSIETLESYLRSTAPTSEESTASTKGKSIARKGDDKTEIKNNEHANSDSTTDQGNESTDVPMERDD